MVRFLGNQEPGQTQHQQVFAMSVGHGGIMVTMERNKHMAVIDNRGSNDSRGQGPLMQELVTTSGVDWIDIWLCIYWPTLVP